MRRRRVEKANPSDEVFTEASDVDEIVDEIVGGEEAARAQGGWFNSEGYAVDDRLEEERAVAEAREEVTKTRKRRSKRTAPRDDDPLFVRLDDGSINNCSLANGEPEKDCQICHGTCPDRALFARALETGDSVETSRKLQQALEESARESKIGAARAAVFDSANAVKEVPFPPVAARIVETHFDESVDIDKEHQQLEAALDSADTKPGHQVHELERAEHNARRAFKLYLRFRQLRDEWEQDNRVLFASMREEAQRTLQHEKDTKQRSKQITDADVEHVCALMFPDEMRAQERQRNRARLTEKSLEHLAEMWSSKARSLGVLVSKGR